MLYEERDSERVEHVPAVNNGLQCDGVSNAREEENIALGIRITNATAQWTPVSHEKTLNKVTVDIKPGMLVAVIGPVGAGKVRTTPWLA
jgi:ABC-type multidrug transport system fused ATPase/permease subunit